MKKLDEELNAVNNKLIIALNQTVKLQEKYIQYLKAEISQLKKLKK